MSLLLAFYRQDSLLQEKLKTLCCHKACGLGSAELALWLLPSCQTYLGIAGHSSWKSSLVTWHRAPAMPTLSSGVGHMALPGGSSPWLRSAGGREMGGARGLCIILCWEASCKGRARTQEGVGGNVSAMIGRTQAFPCLTNPRCCICLQCLQDA